MPRRWKEFHMRKVKPFDGKLKLYYMQLVAGPNK